MIIIKINIPFDEFKKKGIFIIPNNLLPTKYKLRYHYKILDYFTPVHKMPISGYDMDSYYNSVNFEINKSEGRLQKLKQIKEILNKYKKELV